MNYKKYKKYKKYISIIFLILIAMPPAYAETTTAVTNRLKGTVMLFIGSPAAYADRKPLAIEPENPNAAPFIENGRAYVPLRFISESLGADVDWDENKQKATVSLSGTVIEMTVDVSEYSLNGNRNTLDAPPVLRGERTYIPIRVIAEGFGKEVFWDDSGLIIISEIKDILGESEKEQTNLLAELFDAARNK
jgi:hypothetical protein